MAKSQEYIVTIAVTAPVRARSLKGATAQAAELELGIRKGLWLAGGSTESSVKEKGI